MLAAIRGKLHILAKSRTAADSPPRWPRMGSSPSMTSLGSDETGATVAVSGGKLLGSVCRLVVDEVVTSADDAVAVVTAVDDAASEPLLLAAGADEVSLARRRAQ